MSFGGGFGSGGAFGSSSNQPSNTGFGGFGSTNNNNTGGGFGASSTGGNLFGASNPTSQNNPFSGGFGSNTSGGGFGANTNNNTGSNSLFGGNKPGGFGTSSGSLFGNNNTATSSAPSGGSTFGGFGTNNTSGGFGGVNTGNTGNSLFGGNKPGFGASSTTTSTPFGGGGFGGSPNTGGFGSGTALGGQVPPCEGTATAPFAPHVDKEGVGSSQVTNHFQTITMQQPYQKYSQEELRLADYEKGRRWGSGSGFGQTTGFGGGFGTNTNSSFGAGNSNPFGGTSNTSNTSNTAGFGAQPSTTGGAFGGTSGSNLFGANKPSGGLFGSSTSGTNSGTLFGAAPNTSTAPFGGFQSNQINATANNGTSGGLFGGNNNQKPGGLFGTNNSTTGTGTTSLFGGGNPTPSNTGNSLFGGSNNNTSGSTLFGSQPNNSNSNTGFGFGQPNQNQQNKPLFGQVGQTNNQASGGLFGSTSNNTNATGGGGLFGSNTNQPNTGGSLFGNNNASNTANKPLFGNTNDNQKPGGLFGSTNNANTTSLGGFGSNQNANQGGGGLFGNLNNNNQAGSNTFGGSTNTGGGLFANNNKPAGFGGFGASQNQAPGNSLFSSNSGSTLFGGSQNQQANQQPQALHSSLLDGNPYGQSSIWSGLPTATSQNTGPLLTPLSASQRLKDRQQQPSFKLTPLSASKLMTPPRRTGYGFSYSTYGSPSSASSTPTGGSISNGLYGKQFTGGSFGRSMGKSYSASNLRSQYTTDSDSVLAPGAFAPGSSRYSSGSIRRLTIDKNARTESLFSSRLALPPTSSTSNGATSAKTMTNGTTNGTNNGTTNATTNGTTNGAATTETEPEQQGKLKKRVSFGQDPVMGDLNGSLNGMTGAIIRTNSDDNTSLNGSESSKADGVNATNGSDKSEMEIRGNELQVVPEDREPDVVSQMRLPQDAPAAPDPKPGQYWMEPSREVLAKMPQDQLKALKGFSIGRKQCGKVNFDEPVDLTAVNLDDLYGNIVVIEIRSITVYPDASKKPPLGRGLNVPSTLRIENSWPRNRNTPSPATSGPLYEKHVRRLQRLDGTQFVSYDNKTGVWTFKVPHYTRYALDFDEEEDDSSLTSPPDTPPSGVTPAESAMELDDADDSSLQDDTFGYKKSFPGAYSRKPMNDENDHILDDGSAGTEDESTGSEDGMDMAGSYPNEGLIESTPSSVCHGTPEKHILDLEGEWADQLRRTISPRKQDRQALREAQGRVLIDVDFGETQKPANTNEFRTSIDLMNSLFGKHEERQKALKKQGSAGKDFEWPYPKRSKHFDSSTSDLDATDSAWHRSFKPRWTVTGSLIHARRPRIQDAAPKHPWDWSQKRVLSGGRRDIGVASVSGDDEEYQSFLASWNNAQIKVVNGVPAATMKKMPFVKYIEHLREKSAQEGVPLDARMFHVARILFDDYEDEFSAGLTREQKQQYRHRIIKDRFSSMWKKLIQENMTLDRKGPHRLEELAIDLLAANDVKGACQALLKSRNLHLATLVSRLEKPDAEFKKGITNQIETWRNQNVISEMTDPIRALYTICSGNTTICDGKPTAPKEDRASTFGISERFGLSWMQAFGLYLWYSIDENEPIENAIQNFASKLASKEESAFPSDSTDESPSTTKPMSSSADIESPYWVLLKLYASTVSTTESSTEPSATNKVTLPQSLSSLSSPSNSFSTRLLFQLHHALAAHLQSLTQSHNISIDPAQSDHLASTFSFQLSAAGYYIGAIFPLLFLHHATERERAIKTLLSNFAAHLPSTAHTTDSEPTDSPDKESWHLLTTVLQIPQPWLFQAKALHARACNNYLDELRCLLEGSMWRDAHECLCRRVAPRAVIDEDFEVVRRALQAHGKEMQASVAAEEWATGGGLYEDFIGLERADKGHQEKDPKVLRRVVKALVEVGGRHSKKGGKRKSDAGGGGGVGGAALLAGGIEELEERVAVKEMSGRVAGWVLESTNHGNGRGEENFYRRDVLNLPLTADARLDVTRRVGAEYYRGVVAAAR